MIEIQLTDRLKKDRKNKKSQNFNIKQVLWIIFHYTLIFNKKKERFLSKINIHLLRINL